MLADLPLLLRVALWCLITWVVLVVLCLGWLAWALKRAPSDTDLWLGGDPDNQPLASEARSYGTSDRRPS